MQTSEHPVSSQDWQKQFDAAVSSLQGKFPRRRYMITMDHLWKDGAKYLPEIESMANIWNDSQKQDEPLQPTADFSDLLADAAWFVHDNDTTGIMSLVIDCANKVYQKLPEEQRNEDQRLGCDIIELLSIRALTNGDYESSRHLAHAALDVHQGISPQEKHEELRLSNYYNYIALALDSLEKHEDAKVWLDKSAAILRGHDNDDQYVRLSCQNNLNAARNLYCVGKFDDAEQRLDKALEQATRLNSWYSLAYVHETYASLYTRSGDLDKAKDHAKKAITFIDPSDTGTTDSFKTGSWINGLCRYRRASAAFAIAVQGLPATQKARMEDKDLVVWNAVVTARQAVRIGNKNNLPLGSRARAAHVLSRALALYGDKDEDKEAAEVAKEARELRSQMGPLHEGDDESDHAYDMLVSIIQR